MIPTARQRAWLTKAARQYIYSAGAGILFAAVTVKIFWFTPADQVTALSGPYSALITAVAIFIGAIIGIQRVTPQPGPQPFQSKGGPDAHDQG